jgi:PAS domain S-box-containing protein
MDKLDKEKFAGLRQEAEQVLAESPERLQEIPTDIQELIHELQVRNVELEIQNEQLRQIQLELQESHDRYLERYDFAPVGYLTMDSNGLIVQANLAVCALLKTQRNVLLTQPFKDYVKASQLDELENHLRLVRETWSKQTCELRLMTSKRSTVDVEMTTVPIDSPDGDDGLWYRTILIDVSEKKRRDEALQQAYDQLDLRVEKRTRELVRMNEQLKGVVRKREQLADSLNFEVEERKKIEVALRQSEEFFRRTFDEAPIGAAIISMDFQYQRVNSAFCSITGYSAEDLSSLTYLDITHPEERQENLEMAQKLASGEVPDVKMEKRYIRKDGKTVWVLLSVKMIRDISGAPIYYLPMIEDISERKKAENELREEEEKYRLLVQSLPGVVYRGRKDWSVEFIDPKIERFTGYKEKEFHSGRKRWSDLIVEDDLARAKEATVEALREDRSFVREYRIRVADGSIFWVQDRGTLVCDEEGEILYISGVFFDITQRKKLDEQLLEQRQHLRSMAAELALTEERQRRDLAQDLHDSIGQTLALSKLRVDSIRYGEAASKISPELEVLSRNLEDAIEQTQSLIFRLSPPVLYQVGLGEALEYLAELMEKNYGIPIAVSSELDSLALPEDESVLLFRAVQELLINMVKHAHASRSGITLKRSDDQVQVEVQDDGIGFDVGLLSAQGSVKKGFGLLSIRERLHNLGGHMEVQSSPGGGTKVIIAAPLRTETGNTREVQVDRDN